MIGEKIGEYTVTHKLGAGGFGTVYKGLSQDGRFVAIKVLNPHLANNEKVVRKFFNEAMALATLNNENITRLLEFFPSGNNYAIVMEFVEGLTLDDILKRLKGPMPYKDAITMAKQILKPFQYAYEKGILHRDIKPPNIMIENKTGIIKIMDFGIAKISTAATHQTASHMISFHYTAPERFRGTADIRSDIYALGIVFYEMFTGKRPFDAKDSGQIMFCHMNELPKPPQSFSKDIPPGVSSAILKALSKEPDDRYQDFNEFAKAFENFEQVDDSLVVGDEKTVFASRQGLFDHEKAGGTKSDRKSEKKSKAPLIAMIALAILLIAGGAAFYFTRLGPEEKVAVAEPPAVTEPAPVETPKTPPAPVVQPEPAPEVSKFPDVPYEYIEENEKGFHEFSHPVDNSAMVMIPEGQFVMGSDKYRAEKPVQTIFLDRYFFDKFLVTNEKFQKFVEDTGYQTDAEKEGFGYVRVGLRWVKTTEANWRKPDGLSSVLHIPDHPVTQVSYNDASTYCQWAGKKLPTEAQWEKAARGPEGNVFPWGDSEPDITRANYDNVVGTTTPVDKYAKGMSYYGLYDMAGNTYQWCQDWYDVDQRVERNPQGPQTGDERVVKGGSFIEGVESIRSANRDRYAPEHRTFLFGFRCACEPDK